MSVKIKSIPTYDMIEDDISYIQIAIFHVDDEKEIDKFLEKYASPVNWCIVLNGDLRVLGIQYQINMSYAK